jgi:hypothetical protein
VSLREKMVTRLQEWQCAQCDMPLSFWQSLADECIRQMEWARRQEWVTEEMFRTARIARPLTLAPEDWKPWPARL